MIRPLSNRAGKRWTRAAKRARYPAASFSGTRRRNANACGHVSCPERFDFGQRNVVVSSVELRRNKSQTRHHRGRRFRSRGGNQLIRPLSNRAGKRWTWAARRARYSAARAGEMRMPAGAFPVRSGLTSGSATLSYLPSSCAGTNLKLVTIEGGDFAPGAEIG